jgi:CBS domain containing-hemolysin-like protein
MIHIRDLLALESSPNGNIASIARPIFKAPETKPINMMLKEMQTQRRQQAIILDEYGGTLGLVTLEDILEELVGEIHDEHGRPSDFEETNPNHWLILSSTPIANVAERLNIEFEIKPEYDTVGGYAMHQLGLGKDCPVLQLDQYKVSIAEAEGNRIIRLLFVPASE